MHLIIEIPKLLFQTIDDDVHINTPPFLDRVNVKFQHVLEARQVCIKQEIIRLNLHIPFIINIIIILLSG